MRRIRAPAITDKVQAEPDLPGLLAGYGGGVQVGNVSKRLAHSPLVLARLAQDQLVGPQA